MFLIPCCNSGIKVFTHSPGLVSRTMIKFSCFPTCFGHSTARWVLWGRISWQLKFVYPILTLLVASVSLISWFVYPVNMFTALCCILSGWALLFPSPLCFHYSFPVLVSPLRSYIPVLCLIFGIWNLYQIPIPSISDSDSASFTEFPTFLMVLEFSCPLLPARRESRWICILP